MDVPLSRIEAYEEQLYAALLGKLVGVYQGRPFEGWSKAAIEARLLHGADVVDRYVHEDIPPRELKPGVSLEFEL